MTKSEYSESLTSGDGGAICGARGPGTIRNDDRDLGAIRGDDRARGVHGRGGRAHA